jgi:hypothetical protein
MYFSFQTNCVQYAWKHFKVGKALNQSLTKYNIKLGFKACKILLLNIKVMDDKIWPLKIYVGIKNNEENESNTYHIMDMITVNNVTNNLLS